MTFTLDKYMPYTIGFDSFFNTLDSLTGTDVKGYPHYNIKKLDDNKWSIELALAGFSKDEIEVVLTDGVLVVKSADEMTDKDPNEGLVHKGIAKRAFTRKFTLADDIEIKDAKLKNGLLEIELEQIVPEHKKPKVIKVK